MPNDTSTSKTRKLGPHATVVLMSVPLFSLVFFAPGAILYAISGQFLAIHLDHVRYVGSGPSLTKWFLLFAVSATTVLPYVALARWISARDTRPAYWAFAGPATAACLHLLSLLTPPVWWLLEYIHAMGFTPARAKGLIFGLGSYVFVLGFLWWALRPPKKAALDHRVASDATAPDSPVEAR